MIYRQIGNGSAFNYKIPNSSFVILNNSEYILFDCGYNIYQELRRLDEDINDNFDIKNLTNIYISHLDDDHVGSLKTLIYYQFFVNNIVLNICCDCRLEEELAYFLKDLRGYMDESKKIKDDLFLIVPLKSKTLINGINVETTVTSHHVKCYGLILSKVGKALYISGDTKALSGIRNIIDYIDNLYKSYKIFHDYSNFDDEGKQVHACKTDIENLYTKTTISRVQFYHNDAEFDNTWKSL